MGNPRSRSRRRPRGWPWLRSDDHETFWGQDHIINNDANGEIACRPGTSERTEKAQGKLSYGHFGPPTRETTLCGKVTQLEPAFGRADKGMSAGSGRDRVWQLRWKGADGANVDIFEAYRARLLPRIPALVWQEISGRLRRGVRIHFHKRDVRLFRRTTALHNRLAAYLVIEADRELGYGAITVTTNTAFDGPIPKRGKVRIVGQPPFEPLRRYLRLGPDADTNRKPFETILATYPGAVNPPRSATRPESPTLTASAQSRFSALKTIQVAPPTALAAAPSLVIVLSPGARGSVVWASDIGPNAGDEIWSGGRSVALYCGIAAVDAAPVAAVLARLGAHCVEFMLYTKDVGGWRGILAPLCAGNALPGPDLDIRCPVSEWLAPPTRGPRVEIGLALLSATLQDRLDGEVLRQLHAALYEILGPAALQIGWPIEPALRARLWDKWGHWHTSLAADRALCRRYLRLLISEDDREPANEAAMVGAGPKTLRPFMTTSTIFALAFSTCSGLPATPASAHPGNIAFNELTGHSCGVSWIDQRMLGMRAVSEQAWTTAVVLLSQLRDAMRMMEYDVRLDRSFSDAAAVGMISPAEEPLIIGADERFLEALEAGECAMQAYLHSIFRWRSEAANLTLEEVHDD